MPRDALMRPASARTPWRAYGSNRSGKILVNTKAVEVFFARPVLRMLIQQAPGLHLPRPTIRRQLHCFGLRFVRRGRRVASRIGQGADLLRARFAWRAQAGRVSHPRSARGRAQEIWSGKGTAFLPVFEALTGQYLTKGAPRRALFVCRFPIVRILSNAFTVKGRAFGSLQVGEPQYRLRKLITIRASLSSKPA